MSEDNAYHYRVVEKVIQYIQDNFKTQPSLENLAQEANLSPYHFQRIFSEWAGVSPKKFLQYTSLAYAKRTLTEKQATLFNTAIKTGLSGTGRLHDLFVSIEGMTPGEYKKGGQSLTISYQFIETVFGRAIIASTGKGICFLHFEEDEEKASGVLSQNFPNATFSERPDTHIQNVMQFFATQMEKKTLLRLHLKATPFQLKVWEALLKIPIGDLTSYGILAENINQPQASRAVGSAIGKNPVAFLIPCHRVIQTSGLIGGYRWGITRKKAIIGWEAARYKQKFI